MTLLQAGKNSQVPVSNILPVSTVVTSAISGPSQLSKSRVNELPVELLANIFIFWARNDEDGPWMAAAVCQHWRKVALNSSEA